MSIEIRKKAKEGQTRNELLAYIKELVYDDGRTQQAFKDSTDINKLLSKHQTAGSLSHLMKYPEPVYGDFDGEFTLLEAQKQLLRS